MDERLRILELIEAGEIGVEEGARRLEALAESTTSPGPLGGPALSEFEGVAAPVTRPALVRWLWQVVFWTGAGLVVGGGLLVEAVHAGEAAAGWLAWGWLLLALGALGVVIGWWLQRAHWFSLRVRQPDGPNISLALPLPLGPIAWVLRVLRPFVPQLEEMGVDELILAMREEVREGRTLMIEVDEGEGGEQVQIYFG